MTVSYNKNARLSSRLRHETDPAHKSLEACVGFDIHAPSVAAASNMLRRFYGVLRVLEPAMLALVPADLAKGRNKLHLLHHDLSALGTLGDAEAPVAVQSLWLPHNHPEAIGALYVMEGSTLGGKVIVKALRRLADWPITGRSYLDPYGSETGSKWLAFQSYLDGLPTSEADAVVAAAQRTFALLEEQMAAKASA